MIDDMFYNPPKCLNAQEGIYHPYSTAIYRARFSSKTFSNTSAMIKGISYHSDPSVDDSVWILNECGMLFKFILLHVWLHLSLKSN